MPPDETTCGNITILSATAPLVTSMMLKLRWAFFRNHHHSHHYQHRYHHRYYYDHWSLIKQVENAKCAQFRALEQKRKNAEVESSHSIFLKMTARQARLRGTLVWRETGRRSTAWNRCTGLDQGGDGEEKDTYGVYFWSQSVRFVIYFGPTLYISDDPGVQPCEGDEDLPCGHCPEEYRGGGLQCCLSSGLVMIVLMRMPMMMVIILSTSCEFDLR